MDEADIGECEELCLRVHGFERTNELRDAIQVPARLPFVAVRDGRVSAYATTLTFFPAAHAAAELTPRASSVLRGGGQAG